MHALTKTLIFYVMMAVFAVVLLALALVLDWTSFESAKQALGVSLGVLGVLALGTIAVQYLARLSDK